MSNVFQAYCERTRKNKMLTRFLLDGKSIQDLQTPEQLGMEDNEIIDAVVQTKVIDVLAVEQNIPIAVIISFFISKTFFDVLGIS